MLDIVRGWSMFLIAGGDACLLALCMCCSTFPGADWLREQLGHVYWEGFTFYDAIFPTFLLISGASFTYSWEKQCTHGVSLGTRWLKLTIRTFVLIVLGVLYNGALSVTTLSDIRYASVLARIGLGVYLAAMGYLCLPKTWRWTLFPLGLLAYAGLFELCGGEAPYAMQQNWAGRIDQLFLPGRVDISAVDGLDPEGIVSTLGAPLTAYLGMLLADFLRTNVRYKALWIAIAGGCLLSIGYLSAPWVPIIKKLWTSSYVCVAGGWTLLFCALTYFITDCLNFRKWSYPITFFGSAALWFYLLPKVFDFRMAAWNLLRGVSCAITESQAFHLLMCSIGSVLLLWVTVYLFKRALR
jgi:predicted acyltransferase